MTSHFPPVRRTLDKSSKPTRGQDKDSYLHSTLREIREKRLSHDATTKGLFPQRTPSRLLSPSGSVSGKRDTITKDRPTLSLTKLDFELLRDWNWKERQKRLETWGEDLGLTKEHKHFKRSGPGFKDDVSREDDSLFKKRSSHRKKTRAQEGTSKVILKRELEHLTGLRVYAPGDTTQASRRRRSILKGSALPPMTASSTRLRRSLGSVDPYKKGAPSAAGSASTRTGNVQAQVRHQKFETLMKEVNEALEAKKTFGKGWGGGKGTNAHSESTRTRKLSNTLTTVASDQMSIGSMDSEGTRRRHTHIHHHHHHRGRSHGSGHHGHPTTATTHSHHTKYRTDIEEEQPSTSYTSHKSTRVPTAAGRPSATRRSSSPSTPSDSAPGIGLNDLFRGIRRSLDDEVKSDEETTPPQQQSKDEHKYKRPPQPVEYQDTCFGGIRFVDRSAVKPMSKVNKDFEFYMTFDDTQLGLGMGRTQPLKVKFFKSTSNGIGHSRKILARKAAERERKEQEKEEKKKNAELAAQEAAASLSVPSARASTHDHLQSPQILKRFSQLPGTGLLDYTADSGKTRTERVMDFEKALMDLPGISSRWHIEVSVASKRPSKEENIVGRIPKRSQFKRPPRRIWYTPLPLTIKKYYRTNWKKIRYDIRKLMKDKQFWPKLWINFEESHPQKLYELIRAKLAVKDFDKHGFKRVFDWGRGIHPDYIDWILEDIVPHPGRYNYPRRAEDENKEPEAVRRASVEEADFRLKEWFVKPPRYIPDTPLSPPFDQFDFCGYGNREKPFFLAFTLPREILHYYAPPSNIQKFFRTIPKPPYAFPGYTFKRWLNYPLEQKLPQYYPFPTRFMTWTRGKVGEPVQCNSSNFYNDDPYIKKRDIVYSPYHDNHTRKYILRRDILDRIWALGIINSKGEVKCSMSEFNKNRLYLREYEWLEEALRRWDMQWNDRQQQNRLTKDTNFDDLDWETRKIEWNLRLERCKRNTEIRDKEEEKKFRNIVEKTERTLEAAEKRKERIRQQIIERARQKQKAQVKRRQTLYNMEALRKHQLQHKYDRKEKNALRHRKQHFLEKMVDKMERERERWKRHLAFHQMKVAKVKRIERELENEYRMRVMRHKVKVRAEWADVPYAIIRSKLKENYAMSLALKYGRIWLEKVRERRKRLPDEAHLSAWIHERHLESTVKYLKDESGYVDMNTFFFNAFRQALLEQNELLDEDDDEIESVQYQERPKTRRRESSESEDEDGERGDLPDDETEDEEEEEEHDDETEDEEGEEEHDDDNASEGYEADEEA